MKAGNMVHLLQCFVLTPDLLALFLQVCSWIYELRCFVCMYFFRFHIQMGLYSICLSMTDLFYLAQCIQGPSTLSQMPRFLPFYGLIISHCLLYTANDISFQNQAYFHHLKTAPLCLLYKRIKRYIITN